jgi:hypothetical protein
MNTNDAISSVISRCGDVVARTPDSEWQLEYVNDKVWITKMPVAARENYNGLPTRDDWQIEDVKR